MTESHVNLSDAAARSLTINAEPWLSCDGCFDTVDAHVERLLVDGTAFPPAFRAHLFGCSACYEEARSLATLAAPDCGLHPDLALARFEWATR